MKLKSCEKKVKILEKMFGIPIIGLIVALFCILFLSDVIVSFTIIGISVMVLFLFGIMLIYAEEDLEREKVNFYLKENEYIEIFIKENSEIISDIIKENNITFFAKRESDSILVNGVKEDTEFFSYTFDDYGEFFSCFNVGKV